MSDYTLSANSFCHVTLKDPSNWELWLLIIKTIAEQFEVWDLCDPELDTEPALPEEPIAPSWKDLKRDHPMDWYHIWRVIYTQYKRKLSAYEKKLQGRWVVANAIRQSVHEKYQVFLDQETPWGLLRYLRQWFSPDCDPTYKASLRAAWRNFDQGLDKDTDIDEWLLNWQTLQKRCVKVGITNDSEASAQFLLAISVMSPEFFIVWIKLAETSSASTKSQEEKQADFGSLLTRYRAHWLVTHGKPAQQRGISNAVFSTWQGHQEAQPGDSPSKLASKSSGKKPFDFPFGIRHCPCTEKTKPHLPWKWWAAFPEDKPAHMQDTHLERKKTYDGIMKEEPDWKAFVIKKRATEKTASKSKEQPQQANTALRVGELGFFTAEIPPVNDAFLTREPEKIRHDQEHSMIDHNHSMFHQTRYAPIHDRWLIDTGAQVHIYNNRSLFIEFQEKASSIRVGDTETIVNGIGTVLIYGISQGENETPKQMLLFNVTYSRGFHTNLISRGLMFSKARASLNFEENWDSARRHPIVCCLSGSKSTLVKTAR